MRVYRLEARGEGVFQRGYFSNTEDALYKEYGCTMQDYRNCWPEVWLFACDSIDKLIAYFGSDFAPLLDREDVQLMEYNLHKANVVVSNEDQIELVFKLAKVKEKMVIYEKGDNRGVDRRVSSWSYINAIDDSILRDANESIVNYTTIKSLTINM